MSVWGASTRVRAGEGGIIISMEISMGPEDQHSKIIEHLDMLNRRVYMRETQISIFAKKTA